MDRGQRAVLIVSMLAEASQALAVDADVELVICRHLSDGMEADVAACFAPEESGGRVLSCHPDWSTATELIGTIGGLDPDSGAQAPLVLQAGHFGQVLVVVPPVIEAEPEEAERRALAFARRDGFAEQHVLLLHEAIPPLMALLPHAVAATQRRERDRVGRDAAREFGLTSRELEVLELLSQGLLATSIASRLSLSPRTVHKHLGNIYDKLGVHDRLVAVSLARGRGLVAA
ncbi:MAG: helix-turn-helix transcriptional regulator [Actinobacteria bacterium]|nr:helix-turn-helix transcriptional regulator [Actinomycetota bacterium]